MNALKIYKSSAGSGKTFTLVKEYLRLVLQSPEDYRSVLAITFTNKAAGEMKTRIIDALVNLSTGRQDALRSVLEGELPDTDLTARAAITLRNILHDYSSFSVGTIDSFFQRILRALARELHLPLRMEVQVDTEDAISEVTDQLLKEAGHDAELTEWLSALILQKLSDDKGWNIENDIKDVAKEILRDREDRAAALPREEIRRIYSMLFSIRATFIAGQKKIGDAAMDIIRGSNLQVSDFAYGNAGVMGHFERIRKSVKPEDFKLKARALEALDDPEKWFTKSSKIKDQLRPVVENQLIKLLRSAHDTVEENYTRFLSANEVLKRLYVFGIVNDLDKKFSAYRKDHNVILLADTARLLGNFISGDDAPFIYEKSGNRFKHLLIDEFQDTSYLQWKNLLPLVLNSLGSGHTTLVVGDPKQSIYRWRGGDVNLLVQNLAKDLRQFRSIFKEEILGVNFRSRKDVVDFNNYFFHSVPKVIGAGIDLNGHPLLGLAYGDDIRQQIAEKNHADGFVRIAFQGEEPDEEEASGRKWKELSLVQMMTDIHSLLERGYAYRDIAILVRTNTEGNLAARYLFENGIEKIISPDSLLIRDAPRIRFLISIFRYLSDPSDTIARTEILYYYATGAGQVGYPDLHALFTDAGPAARRKKTSVPSLFDAQSTVDNHFNKILPEAFTSHLLYLSKLPVYELSEQLVRIFHLNHEPDAYIQRFLDLVLEYSGSEQGGLDGFLAWWDDSKTARDCSVIVPENEDAIRIMTIHRSKGLQFPVLIIPFCDWKIIPKPNELLWVKAQEEPYQEMGRVAVPFSNNLKETFFKDDYLEELSETILDNVNLLYVAFTRAEEQLLVTCPQPKEGELNSAAKLIRLTLEKMELNSEEGRYIIGNPTLEKTKKDQAERSVSVSLEIFPSNRWQEKISVSSRSQDLLALTEDRTLQKKNYGILVHDILSAIRRKQDVERAIHNMEFEGLITHEEKSRLAGEIRTLLALEPLADFFSDAWQVKAERELILPDGEVLRPDRVVYRNREAVVIDFKTGKTQQRHEAQVKKYADVLSQMGFETVRMYLVYIAQKEIREVS